jgi:hypothetical protein
MVVPQIAKQLQRPLTALKPLSSPRKPRRFTIDGSDELEGRIRETCERVLARLQSALPDRLLEGLLLAGGYGRGEGGVLPDETGDQPYNDLEFYVLLRGPAWLNERRYAGLLHRLGEELAPSAGVAVEFKVISRLKLRRSPVNMFYYDLVMGHHRVTGGDDLLQGCEHHREAFPIQPAEATRLLMNRCTGLLLARQQLRAASFTHQNADFVMRNLAKAQLAFGDAILTVHGQYHWSCLERQHRLKGLAFGNELAWLSEAIDHHAAGVSFKLHPLRTAPPLNLLEGKYAAISAFALRLWLWLESRRLHSDFASARAYAFSPLNKCPETSAWRNWLVNAKTFGAGLEWTPSSGRYPRERLLNTLPILLWEPDRELDAKALRHAQRQLATSASDLPGLVKAYEALWHRFN